MARGKKGKLEVKIRPPAVAAEAAEDFGVELWKKFKLGKGGKGDDGEGGRCMVPAQQAELERILTEHGLLDARVQHGACVRACVGLCLVCLSQSSPMQTRPLGVIRDLIHPCFPIPYIHIQIVDQPSGKAAGGAMSP